MNKKTILLVILLFFLIAIFLVASYVNESNNSSQKDNKGDVNINEQVNLLDDNKSETQLKNEPQKEISKDSNSISDATSDEDIDDDSSSKKPSTNNSGASSGSTSNPSSERIVTVKEPIYEYTYWIKDANGTYLYTTKSATDFQAKKLELISDPNVDSNWTWGSGNVILKYETFTMLESDFIGSPWETREDCIITYSD